ncbi:hypothetical protein ACFQ5M_11415 [Agrilactobacillus yilanensis]|uniref:Uncharacterized protein n=1 Tax=Agrilactobacillus yilanensis TaxID=2485997 RepID=A0ABW4JBA1_9LACO|nr:hypothetical protein [Agrilactobacillus yilanensis]
MSEHKDQAKTPDFLCPGCHEKITYGLKECPSCHIKIYYRDMSETFWNARKLKLLKNSPAIQ